MILESTRLIDRWLRHDLYGVAAMLETVERETSDGTSDPLPDAPTIFNDLESELAGQNIDPPEVPALVVFVMDSSPRQDAKPLHRQQSTVVVSVAYITRDMPPVRAAIDGGYVMRAVKKSLHRFNDTVMSKGYRDLNGIKIASCDSLTTHRVAGTVGRSQLWGFVLASLTVLDNDL